MATVEGLEWEPSRRVVLCPALSKHGGLNGPPADCRIYQTTNVSADVIDTMRPVKCLYVRIL